MIPTIYNSIEVIETVYTYEEWLKEYNRRKSRKLIRQRTEHLHYIKQKFFGVVITCFGIITPFLLSGDGTLSIFLLPFGIFLIFTKEKAIML